MYIYTEDFCVRLWNLVRFQSKFRREKELLSKAVFTSAKVTRKHWRQWQWQWHEIVLALATLGDATKIVLILIMSLCPRWPSQVSNDCRCRRHYRITFTNVNDPLLKQFQIYEYDSANKTIRQFPSLNSFVIKSYIVNFQTF
jgi:hypothetical protein